MHLQLRVEFQELLDTYEQKAFIPEGTIFADFERIVKEDLRVSPQSHRHVLDPRTDSDK